MVKNVCYFLVGLLVICAVYCGLLFCGVLMNVIAALAGVEATVAIMCVVGFLIGVVVYDIKRWMETVWYLY